MADKLKKLVRELQERARGTVAYSTCRRLLIERGFDAAAKQIDEWLAAADVEVARLKEPQ